MHRPFYLTMLLCSVLLGGLFSAAIADEEAGVFKLSEPFTQLAWAGSGRFVALQMKSGKTQVYNLAGESPALAFEIPNTQTGDLLAGSAESLAVVSPGKMMVQLFDLGTGKRKKLTTLAGSDPPRQAHLGSAGAGPLLIVGGSSSLLLDLETLKPISIEGPKFPGVGRYGFSVQVSPEGKTFGSIPEGYGPVGYTVWKLDGKKISSVKFGSTSDAIRWAQPSGDGYLLMLPGGGLYNGNGRPMKVDGLKGTVGIPTPDPGLITSVRMDQSREGKRRVQVTLRTTADSQEVASRSDLTELLPKQIYSWHDIKNALRLSGRWRLQYLPDLKKIITLPAGNDRIVTRSWDVRKDLKREKKDYLFVTSVPPLSVEPGKTMTYRLNLLSRSKKVRLQLEAGPEGAQITKRNQLKWPVPQDFTEDYARFLISIKGANDQEVFHSFEVAIRRPKK